jgi:hypothetical protein
MFFVITVIILIKLRNNVTVIFILKFRAFTNFRSNEHPLAPISLLNRGFTVIPNEKILSFQV